MLISCWGWGIPEGRSRLTGAHLTPGCSLPSLTSWGRVCGSGILFKGVLWERRHCGKNWENHPKRQETHEWFRFPSHFSVLFLCPNAYSSLLCLQLCIRSCHAVDKSFLLHSCIHGQAFSSCDCAHSSFNKWKGSKSEWKSTWMLTAVQAKGIWCLQAWFPESAAADWTNSQESKHGLCQSAFSSHFFKENKFGPSLKLLLQYKQSNVQLFSFFF